MNPLRRISLHVDEPDPGHFHWVLMEEVTDAFTWAELSSSKEGYDMWIDAWRQGSRALLALTEDQTQGPRSQELAMPSFADPMGARGRRP